jgi:3-phenylpropionate/trans-cinnamate dioxygenase ferredoxin reductase subunit
VVIAGAGHAAGQLLATLRQQGYDGHVVVVGDEPCLPYQRPPLSKKYLAGELPAERLNFKPSAFYDALDVEFKLETRVDSIDRDAREVVTDGGERIHYDTLFLATGSRVRKLSLPGSDLDGIGYLRSIADADALRDSFASAGRLAVIGAGYIGLEVAAVARSNGIDVTVIEMTNRVMSRVVSPAISEFYEAEHLAQGVKFEFGVTVTGFKGANTIESVELGDGRSIEADLAVVGIGVAPNSELAEAAGLGTANGIVVDERCRTSDPAIYAVGDCTAHPSAVYERRVRLESVQNALDQARIAVVNACGGDETYNAVPWFWSDQYDLKLQIAGLSEGYDEVVRRGDPAERSFSCAYLREGRLIAVDAVNSPKDFMQSKALIAAGAVPDPARLADIGVDMRDTLPGTD